MNIWYTLEKIRNKPEPARQAVALFLAIISTAIIVGLWLWFKTFPETPVPMSDTPSPLQVLWNYIKSFGE